MILSRGQMPTVKLTHCDQPAHVAASSVSTMHVLLVTLSNIVLIVLINCQACCSATQALSRCLLLTQVSVALHVHPAHHLLGKTCCKELYPSVPSWRCRPPKHQVTLCMHLPTHRHHSAVWQGIWLTASPWPSHPPGPCHGRTTSCHKQRQPTLPLPVPSNLVQQSLLQSVLSNNAASIR
jgi:hypothetical protein